MDICIHIVSVGAEKCVAGFQTKFFRHLCSDGSLEGRFPKSAFCQTSGVKSGIFMACPNDSPAAVAVSK